MANICENHVHVEAKPEVIERMVKAIKWEWLFEEFVPYDEETKKDIELEKIYGYYNRDCSKDWKPKDWTEDWYTECPYKQLWYSFRNKYRWSKWDIIDCDILYRMDYNIENGRLTMDFESAWCPHIEWREKISKDTWCKVHLEFSETWMEFSWIYVRDWWELIQQDDREWDAYYGNWKRCSICNTMRDNENSDDWMDEAHTVCIYCEWFLNRKEDKHEDK